ncbi:hypothetical protein DVA81_18610, partial [Acinetobacter baumannii]
TDTHPFAEFPLYPTTRQSWKAATEFTSTATHEAASAAASHVKTERKNVSVLCKLFCDSFIVSTTCFNKKVFSNENKPHLLKEKLQDCEAA